MARRAQLDGGRATTNSYLTLAVVLLLLVLVFMAIQYAHLRTQANEACSQISAAAKLDLSSLVPLCKDVQ